MSAPLPPSGPARGLAPAAPLAPVPSRPAGSWFHALAGAVALCSGQRWLRTAWLVALWSSAGLGFGQPSPAPAGRARPAPSPPASTDAQITALLQAAEIPGLSLAVIRAGKVQWAKGYGLANAQTQAPVQATTVFEAASLGKPVFAYLVLQLVDQGVITLDAPLSQYLRPGFDAELRPLAERLTARMVLSHTTGLPNARAGKAPLVPAFTPGQRFSYSGEGFGLLQQVLEHHTGQSLDALMTKHVFGPLGMTSSSYAWRPEYAAAKAYAHNELLEVAGQNKPLAPHAASSLHTTAGDYARFLQAMLRAQGLRKPTHRQMVSSQVRVDSTCVNCLAPAPAPRLSTRLSWGLGWGLEAGRPGTTWLWHWGDNGNYKAFVVADAKGRNALVYFANGPHGLSIAEELSRTLLNHSTTSLKWVGYEPYNTPIKQQLRQIVATPAPALADLQARANRREFSVKQYNWLGQQLANRRRFEAAQVVFGLSLAQDSTSLPARLGLGESYLQLNNRPLALLHLRRAAALVPGNARLARKVNLLAKPAPPLNPAVLQTYAGRYQSPLGVLTIRQASSRLFAQLEGNPEEELLPDTPTVFVSADAGVQLKFSDQASGVPQITITAGPQEFLATKL